MEDILNKITIKQKVFVIVSLSILFLLLSAAINQYSLRKINKSVLLMSSKELWLKNTATEVSNYISKLNKTVVTNSIAEEDVKKTDEIIEEYNDDILDDLTLLSNFAKKNSLNKLSEILKKISIRYKTYYKIAHSLPAVFAKDEEDGIDAIIGMSAISKKIDQEIDTLLIYADKNFNNRMNNIINTMNTTKQFMIYTFIFAIFIFMTIAQLFSSSIVKTLHKLNIGVSNLLNSNEAKEIELNVKGEVAQIISNFNKYIKNINNTLAKDKELIQNAKEVINRVKRGWYDTTITKSTPNEALEEFKNVTNDMIDSIKNHFVTINNLLSEYTKLDYRNKLVLEDIDKGSNFDILQKDINILRDSIVEMLHKEQNEGEKLKSISNQLLQNVKILNNGATESATSLEETAASLEQITSNIRKNSENVVKMTQYANEVTNSANEGLSLAQKTTVAMNEIDEQVKAINEAISVIDQIAFQTNILSLNAAVEAATAGEAGKGFAVVAGEVRNLAARSAEAANEIKRLVETATNKANEGKDISDEMIEGYKYLNGNITKTLEIINSVEIASKEQLTGIEQINDAVSLLDTQTQKNVSIAHESEDIANATLNMATEIVENINKKKF